MVTRPLDKEKKTIRIVTKNVENIHAATLNSSKMIHNISNTSSWTSSVIFCTDVTSGNSYWLKIDGSQLLKLLPTIRLKSCKSNKTVSFKPWYSHDKLNDYYVHCKKYDFVKNY